MKISIAGLELRTGGGGNGGEDRETADWGKSRRQKRGYFKAKEKKKCRKKHMHGKSGATARQRGREGVGR